jgi:uncharacterized protein
VWPCPSSCRVGRGQQEQPSAEIIEETGSDLAARLWDGSDAAVASRLAYPEVRAALAAAARSHALRGADAVHLASALAISDPGLIIAVWDRRLHAGATAAGLRVAPAQLN